MGLELIKMNHAIEHATSVVDKQAKLKMKEEVENYLNYAYEKDLED